MGRGASPLNVLMALATAAAALVSFLALWGYST